MESYGYKPPVPPVKFRFQSEIADFIVQNQFYLKYLYHNYPETPLNEWFYAYKPRCTIIRPNEEGIMCLYDTSGRVSELFMAKYEKAHLTGTVPES